MKAQLRRLIAMQLERRVQQLLSSNEIKVVAITGSVGKTSAKLAIAHVLRAKYRVLAQESNYNSEIGLPLSIFDLEVPKSLMSPLSWIKILNRIDQILKKPFPYEVLVLEMGADKVNDIKKFMRYIKPDVAVITAIQPVHLAGFGSFEKIKEEKMALAHGSNKVLINIEDEGVVNAARDLKGIKTYGLVDADYCLPKTVQLQTIGHPARLASAAAFAVGIVSGIAEKAIIRQLKSLMPVSGRMSPLVGKRGSIIIDDTYNASPQSVIAALDTLYGMVPGGGKSGSLPVRKIAILGNMNELGEYTPKAHEEVGSHCGELDMLLTIGDNAGEFLANAAEKAGLKPEQIHRFISPYEAGLYLDDRLQEGDVVLAKGSQDGVFAEESVALLLANPNDRTKLVRQSFGWQARKKKQFGVK